MGPPQQAHTFAVCLQEASRGAVVHVLVALVGLRDVREVDLERTIVHVHAVAEQIVRRPVRVAVTLPEALDQGADDRAIAAREGAQVDVRDVVLEPPAVREPGEVAREDAEPVALADRCAGRDARVQAQQLGLVVPGEVEPRDAGEMDRDEVAASSLGSVVEDRIERVLEPGHLWLAVLLDESLFVVGVLRVPAVLAAQRDHDLVHERVREP